MTDDERATEFLAYIHASHRTAMAVAYAMKVGRGYRMESLERAREKAERLGRARDYAEAVVNVLRGSPV